MATSNTLKVRFASALLLGALVLGIMYQGDLYFQMLMVVAAVIGIFEWVRMVATDRYRIIFMPLGIVYICFSVATMVWLRDQSPQGFYNLLTLLLIVWASDISAYFSGRAIGGPKLAPAISPNKTWAGFIGSSVGAGIVSAGLACPWVLDKFGVDTIGGLSPLGYAAMGFVLAMFGQLGDLFISIFKRRTGVKDTGVLIPGHGGLLDRIDALLLVSLLFGAFAMQMR